MVTESSASSLDFVDKRDQVLHLGELSTNRIRRTTVWGSDQLDRSETSLGDGLGVSTGADLRWWCAGERKKGTTSRCFWFECVERERERASFSQHGSDDFYRWGSDNSRRLRTTPRANGTLAPVNFLTASKSNLVNNYSGNTTGIFFSFFIFYDFENL